jgi:hypothetical protein
MSMNPIKAILGDKYSRDKKTTINTNCDYCQTSLYYDDKEGKNYIYHKGKYWCKDCFINVSKKERMK